MEWICSADMPWMWRIHMTFSSSLIMQEILDSICGGKNRNLTFSYLLLTYQGTKITRVVVQCSEAWTKRITTAVACLREKLQSCLPNLYQKHSKNCEISKHFLKPIFFWDSWPVHTLVPFPFKQSPYILLKLLPRIDHLDYFPWDNWQERMSLSSLTESD